MGWRTAGALLLAAMLAGCSEMRDFSGFDGFSKAFDFSGWRGLNDFAMATPEPAKQAHAPSRLQGDPSFRVSELKQGMTRAQIEAMYPNRLALDSSDSRNQLYIVEPLGMSPGNKAAHDRLELFVSDGKLAAFGVVHSEEAVVAAAMTTLPAPSRATARAGVPGGKYGVQIAARRSEAEARSYIDEMRAKYPSLLAREWAGIHRVELQQGVYFRVVIGPLDSAQQAMQMCNSLKAGGTECFIRRT